MSRRVRRADRHRRCPRCGFEQTYPQASVKEANRWFRRHSCQKREDAMVRAIQYAQRLELIDRTPKPCLHKMADHQHGTNACYVLDGCRCEPCAEARMEQDRWRNRQKAYGRYAKYVDAEPVRAHLAELRAYGIGLKRVAKLSGVSNGSLTKIWYGLYGNTGRGHEDRRGEGVLIREPAHRVLRSTAERIYAVEPVPANLGSGQADHERTPAARLHLQALVALGWSQNKLCQRLGIQPGNFTRIIAGTQPMKRETVDAIEALYAELCMTLPPQTNQRERISVSRARRHAREHGWLPPLALDDDRIYDPTYRPNATRTEPKGIDEVVVRRLLDGQRIRSTAAEKREAMRRWLVTGRSERSLCLIHGWKEGRYTTDAQEVAS